MRHPLTDQLKRETAAFGLRSSCVDCFFYVEADGRCAHGWPNEQQRVWPLPADAEELPVCKEFELR